MTTLFTAAFEAQNPEEDETGFFPSTASYLVAADTHSIANANQTFFDSAGETISNIPKFIGASIISGVNQIYNIAPSIGNMLGGDFELSATADVMQSIDSDLATYYKEHEGSVDTVGFILSSLVPGLAGVKGLRAVQSSGALMLRTAIKDGKVGEGMGRALGLLTPSRQKHLDAAIKQINATNSTFKVLDRNVLKAMGAGFGQNMLEAAAFETAVAATLFDSPVLEGQDISDLVYNIAFGGLAFGAIGGGIDATRAVFQLKKARVSADAEAMPWRHIEASSGTPADRIANDFDQIASMPEVPAALADERIAFLKSAAESKVTTLRNQIRSDMAELSGEDQIIAEALFQATKNSSGEQAIQNFLGARSATRLSTRTEIESTLKGLLKKRKDIFAGKGTLKEAEEFPVSELEALEVTYMKNWGEGMGDISTSRPVVNQLADTLKKGESLVVGKKGVRVVTKNRAGEVVKNIKSYDNSIGTPWDIKSATALEANARHIWAQKLPAWEVLTKDFVRGEKGKVLTIDGTDMPLMEKLYREFDPSIQVKLPDKEIVTFADQGEVLNFIQTSKEFLAVELGELTVAAKTKVDKAAMKVKVSRLVDDETAAIPDELMPAYEKRASMFSQDEIATILNVKNSYLSGMVSKDTASDMFALQSHAEDYTKFLVKQGSRKETDPILDVWEIPQHTKLTYNKQVVNDIDGNVLEGMAVIKEQQRLHVNTLHKASASVLGNDFNKLAFLSDKDVMKANTSGAGPKLAAAASNNYGSAAAKAEWNGNVTTGMKEKATAKTGELLEPALYKLAQNQDAAIEWSTLVATLRSLPDQYVLNEAGDALIPAVMKQTDEIIASGQSPSKIPQLRDPDSPLEIPLKSDEVRELAPLHIEVNGSDVEGFRTLRTAQGVSYSNRSDVFYPPPPNIKDFPFFATVTDEAVTGAGHTKMIYANTEEQLQQMIAKISSEPTFKVRTKADAENYWKSIGQFEFEKTLNENHMNSALQRKGVSSPAIIPTDPKKIVDELLSWHKSRSAGLVMEAVSTAMEKEFTELRRLGDAFTGTATSRFGALSTLKHADDIVENPYMDYVRTSLGLRNYTDYPFWTSANKLVDSKFTKMYQSITGSLKQAKSPAELDQINATLRANGYKGAAYDEQMELLANHTAPKGALSAFVRRGNAILASVVLRLDHLNAINNAVGANVLLGAETKAVIRAIGRGDEAALGELSKLMDIAVPGGEGALMKSPAKLMKNAVLAYGSKDKTKMQFFRDNRYLTTITEQYNSTLDDLVLQGTESVADLGSKITSAMNKAKKLADVGERVTGNRMAEEFNRFVAAHVMKEISDVGVSRGLISAQEQLAYINTFVNRTQGNYLAAQRPMMFQGPIGQAIGLFQTYQFNLMQQLLRHVGEGTAKDSMTLLGLQGTIYGLNGLPAFNAINTHIVGNASGNVNHRDTYDTIYGAAGKAAGDWLTYGIASNIMLHPDLKINLYVRGDINPRHPTIVPTSPADVPIVQAFGKMFKNLAETTKTFAKGGDVLQTFIQGLEHNGISRPLAGLAQTLEGFTNPDHQSYSTSKRGNVIASNDMLSLANLGRLIGGKPLDEAVAIDASFRFKAYGLVDSKRRRDLGQAIKTTLIAGGSPTPEQMDNFAAQYTEMGGKQDEFNKWMVQLYKTANTSQANVLQRDLDSKFSKSMQQVMGGFELKDFTNQ